MIAAELWSVSLASTRLSPRGTRGAGSLTRRFKGGYRRACCHWPLLHRRPGASAEATSQRNGAILQPDVEVPLPVVTIDNHSDPFATVVGIQYGNRLGDLLDTMAALKNLRLNITRAKLGKEADPGTPVNHVFYITDAQTSEKVLKSSKVEEIRATILANLVQYHEEAKEKLAWAVATERAPNSDLLSPLGAPPRQPFETIIDVYSEENGRYSVLKISTGDRPGLLTDIVRILKDISVNVVSAEIDTAGTTANDEFYITYHGDALNPSMTTLVRNALQYYLTVAAIQQEDSY